MCCRCASTLISDHPRRSIYRVGLVIVSSVLFELVGLVGDLSVRGTMNL